MTSVGGFGTWHAEVTACLHAVPRASFLPCPYRHGIPLRHQEIGFRVLAWRLVASIDESRLCDRVLPWRKDLTDLIEG